MEWSRTSLLGGKKKTHSRSQNDNIQTLKKKKIYYSHSANDPENIPEMSLNSAPVCPSIIPLIKSGNSSCAPGAAEACCCVPVGCETAGCCCCWLLLSEPGAHCCGQTAEYPGWEAARVAPSCVYVGPPAAENRTIQWNLKRDFWYFDKDTERTKKAAARKQKKRLCWGVPRTAHLVNWRIQRDWSGCKLLVCHLEQCNRCPTTAKYVHTHVYNILSDLAVHWFNITHTCTSTHTKCTHLSLILRPAPRAAASLRRACSLCTSTYGAHTGPTTALLLLLCLLLLLLLCLLLKASHPSILYVRWVWVHVLLICESKWNSKAMRG